MHIENVVRVRVKARVEVRMLFWRDGPGIELGLMLGLALLYTSPGQRRFCRY